MTVKQAGRSAIIVKLVTSGNVSFQGNHLPGMLFLRIRLADHHVRVDPVWVGSFASSTLDGIVWLAPPVQVGTLNETVLLPFGKVRFRSKSIFVPQANELDVETWNGVEFVPSRQ